MVRLLAVTLFAQLVALSSPSLPSFIKINAATLAGLPQQTISATDEHGTTARYTGVSLREILTKAGIPQGRAVRGKQMQTIVVVVAADGYRVVFTLPELDPSFTNRVVLLAAHRNGRVLGSWEGPYRVIVPGDKREARWIRRVTEIEIERAS